MRLLILVSILILAGLNAAAQTEQPHPNPAGVSHSLDRASRKSAKRSPIGTKLATRLATRLSRVCGQWAEYWRQKQLDHLNVCNDVC